MFRHISLRRRIALRATVSTALLLSALAAPPAVVAAPGRVVAIGDIHGEYANLVAILKQAGLLDDALRWSGRDATLVQLGDFTDRGADVRRVMDLFMALEGQARKAGGLVVVLLGNHEVMNLLGEMRDVTPAILATFADAGSEARREAAYQAYARLGAARSAVLPARPAVYRQSREEWMAAHPPGFVEYREAFAPRGAYGRWLRERPIVSLIGDTIFMHAGIDPDAAPGKLDDVNSQVRREIRRFDAYVQRLVDRKRALPFFTLQEILDVSGAEIEAANEVVATARESGVEADLHAFDTDMLLEAQQILRIGSWSVLNPGGPLWFRGYATWESNESTAAKVDGLLSRYKAAHVVVGHTPIRSAEITPRFGTRVVLLDTGMLTSYYPFGQPSALEIDGGVYSAIYLDKKVPLARSDTGGEPK